MNLKDKTDEELAALAKENADIFAYIVERYEDKLLRYIHRMTLASKEEAEDLLQEVFIKVYKYLNDFDESLKFSSWVYRITRNEVVSSWRKKKVRPVEITFEDDAGLLNIASELDLNRNIEKKEIKKQVSKLLNKLDKKYREVLILRFLEEKDYKEISDILKKPHGTVATLINRAKKKLFSVSLQSER